MIYEIVTRRMMVVVNKPHDKDSAREFCAEIFGD